MKSKSVTLNPYEEKYGYSRAVRRGPFVFVSGTTSIDVSTGEVLHPDSAYRQTRQIFKEIITALEAVEAKREHVVRIRMFVTDEKDSDDVGQVMKEMFGDIQPAATMIIGAKFVSQMMLVEIEVDAVVCW